MPRCLIIKAASINNNIITTINNPIIAPVHASRTGVMICRILLKICTISSLRFRVKFLIVTFFLILGKLELSIETGLIRDTIYGIIQLQLKKITCYN